MKRMLLGLACLALSALGLAQDEGWIQEGINAAIASGQTHYDIPAGTYDLSKQLVIPAGTHNFALRGAGALKTILRPHFSGSRPIRIGYSGHVLWNDWPLPSFENFPIESADTGDRKVKVQGGNPSGWGVVYDTHVVSHVSNHDVARNRAEIVYVNSDGSIDGALGREYNENPSIAMLGDRLCQNISISGFGLDGAESKSLGLVEAGYVVGLSLNDLYIENFGGGGVYIILCRDVTIKNVTVKDATSTGPGAGYGIWVAKSREVQIENCLAENCRHGYVLHSGTMDALIMNCVGNRANFDTHGYDERRITFWACSGNTSIDIGNTAWREGSKDVIIGGCDLGGPLSVNPDVTGLRAFSSSFGGMDFYSSGGEGALDMHCFLCEFTRGKYVVGNPSRALYVGKATFDQCRFVQTRPEYWWRIADIRGGEGLLMFRSCEFVNPSSYLFRTIDSVKIINK